MTLLRMDHVGINFADLEAAVAFFVELGFELQGEWSGDDPAVGRIIGLEGARTDVAMLKTMDGHAQLELIRFREPSIAGRRHAGARPHAGPPPLDLRGQRSR